MIREGAEANGYRVEGFAPTSRAAQKLSEAGIETSTLQLHLAKGQKADNGEKRLYILDESSRRFHQADARFCEPACIRTTACCWWGTRGSTKLLRLVGRSRSCRRQACLRPSWTRSCASGTQH